MIAARRHSGRCKGGDSHGWACRSGTMHRLEVRLDYRKLVRSPQSGCVRNCARTRFIPSDELALWTKADFPIVVTISTSEFGFCAEVAEKPSYTGLLRASWGMMTSGLSHGFRQQGRMRFVTSEYFQWKG